MDPTTISPELDAIDRAPFDAARRGYSCADESARTAVATPAHVFKAIEKHRPQLSR